MDELEYSAGARNQISNFYNVDKVLYVEGEDDIFFWEVILEKVCPNIDFKLLDVGGKPNLAPYIDQIDRDEANFIVAIDSDFEFLQDTSKHDQIIRTYGYSIENSILCPISISKTLRRLGRLSDSEAGEGVCKIWLEELERDVEELLLYDIHNELSGHGEKILGINYNQLVLSKSSCSVCPQKVQKKISQLSFNLSAEEQRQVIEKVKNAGLKPIDLFKGHFIFSAVQKFVSVTVKNHNKTVSISNDALFAGLISVFEAVFDKNHPEFDHYKLEVSTAV